MTSPLTATTFSLEAPDGTSLFVYSWLPAEPVRAVVRIAHGWAEHAGRYSRVADALCHAGYAVYANDHRGHGRTATTAADLGFFAEHDGWNKCIGDLWQLHQRISAAHPGAPIVAFGHSMASFMTQQFMSEHGDALAGAVLSGSNGAPPVMARVGLWLARARAFEANQKHFAAVFSQGKPEYAIPRGTVSDPERLRQLRVHDHREIEPSPQ